MLIKTSTQYGVCALSGKTIKPGDVITPVGRYMALADVVAAELARRAK